MADVDAQQRVSGVHPAERKQDDGGAAEGHQSQPSDDVCGAERRVPQLLRQGWLGFELK